jgi:hypothetical protein
VARGRCFDTPTGVHFDAAGVVLDELERTVLYAVAEHQLLRSPCATLRGGEGLCGIVERLVRLGFIDATKLGWSDGTLTVCGRLTEEGKRFLTGSPLSTDDVWLHSR